MFEAHYSHIEDFQGIDTIETVAKSWTKTYYRRHKLSAQPLKIWFARGKRQKRDGGSEQRIFAYIEYEDTQGKHHGYATFESAAGPKGNGGVMIFVKEELLIRVQYVNRCSPYLIALAAETKVGNLLCFCAHSPINGDPRAYAFYQLLSDTAIDVREKYRNYATILMIDGNARIVIHKVNWDWH